MDRVATHRNRGVLGLLTLATVGRAQYAGDGDAPAPPPPPPLMPFNPAVGFNPTMSPEWQQMMMQKMAAQEQAAFQQQVQAYQAWAKANPKEAAAMEKAYRAQMDPNAGIAARRPRKKTAATKSRDRPGHQGGEARRQGGETPGRGRRRRGIPGRQACATAKAGSGRLAGRPGRVRDLQAPIVATGRGQARRPEVKPNRLS